MTYPLNHPKFAIAQSEFESACHCSRAYSEKLVEYLNQYGAHGAAVSGAGRDHFPDDVKDHLRRIARAVSRHSDLAYAARPYRVRQSTMRRLGRLVATRDGSGFYGPQPIVQS